MSIKFHIHETNQFVKMPFQAAGKRFENWLGIWRGNSCPSYPNPNGTLPSEIF
jgi:hypothetical protein